MASTQLQSFVDGVDSGPTIIFVHGWPDDHTLFDKQVAHLKDRYRCVTTDLPGFGREDASKWGHTFDDITTRLEKTIEAVGNGKPVRLVAHDWGCLFAYMLEKKRPDLVHKLVALDIGGAFSFRPSLSGLFIVMYQAYLVLAFLVGGPIGNVLTSLFCRFGVVPPACPNVARSSVCYVYFHAWKTLITGMITGMDMGPYLPRCPVLFMYGTTGSKRWVKFHADWWVGKINEKEGSSTVGVADADHWFLLEKPDVVNRRLDAFFAED